MIRAYATINVPLPGSPVRVTSGEPDPAANQGCHGVLIQARPTNVGKIFIGRSDLNRTTHVGVMGFLAIPTINQIPSFSAALTLSPGGLQLRDLYIDADLANDGVIVTILVT